MYHTHMQYRNIVNTIKTNEHTLEKYTSLTLFKMVAKGLQKGYCVRGELETEQNCNILTPSSSGYNSTSFSFSWGAQPGALRAQPQLGPGSHSFELQQLTPNSDFQLTQTSCSTGLYNCLPSTCFSERRICTQFNPYTVKVTPLVSSTGYTCYLHWCISYLTARLGRRSICYTKMSLQLSYGSLRLSEDTSCFPESLGNI